MNRPTVLILTSDPDFSREVTANWPRNNCTSRYDDPEFTVLEKDFSGDLKGNHYDLAIADASSIRGKKDRNRQNLIPNQSQAEQMKQALVSAGKPAILIRSDRAQGLYSLQGSVIELHRQPGIWPAFTGLLGWEILRRRDAESRALEAENRSIAAQDEATLGRYMVEMRTNVNNALTTVLGNAELLVQEPGLPGKVAAQADAIRNMALRLHEVFQRFSSLEKELTVAACEPRTKAAAAAGR